MSINLVDVEFSDRKDKAATVLSVGLRQDNSEFTEGIKDFPPELLKQGNIYLVIKLKLAPGANLAGNTEFQAVFDTLHSILVEKGLALEGAAHNPFRQVITKDHLILSINTSLFEFFQFPNMILQTFLSYSNRNSLEGDFRAQSMISLGSVVEHVNKSYLGG